MSTNSSMNERFLCFSLGTEEYGIQLLNVREVIAMPDFTPIPQSPSYFMGIMNLRGQVISGMDLRAKLGIKPTGGAETSVIICDVGGITIGLAVDSVNSVLTPKPEEMSERPELQSSKASDYISGVYRKDKKLILFLDVAKILSVEDRQTAARKPAAPAAEKAAA